MAIEFTLGETIDFRIGGTDYKVKKPSVGLITEFMEKNDEAKGDAKKEAQLTFELFAACGLPQEIAKQLNAEQLAIAVEALLAKKKG